MVLVYHMILKDHVIIGQTPIRLLVLNQKMNEKLFFSSVELLICRHQYRCYNNL